MRRYLSETIVALLLIVSILAVYGQVRNHDFLSYDDDDYITENHLVQAGWTVEGVFWAFRTTLHQHWHPLTWLSHMTDCQFFGLNPKAHHLMNVFFHVANTLLLFFVLRRMTGAPLRSAFVAVLFAVHPLHVEPVAWVADRKDLLSAFFWMLAMVAYVRYAERPGFTRYALVVTAFILGLMAKPMVVTLPFVLLLLDYWPLERFEFGESHKGGHRGNGKSLEATYQSAPALRLLWEKGLFFFILGASAVVTVLVMRHESISALKLSTFWPTQRLVANALVNCITYIGKMLWPLELAVPYPDRLMVPLWQMGGAGLLLFGLSSLVFWQRRRYPYLLVGWLWYLVTLAPVIGLVKGGPHKLADRYTYIPLIGLYIMMAWGVPDLLKGWRHRRMALGLSSALVLSGLMIGAWMQVRHWKTSVALFEHTVKVTPNNYEAQVNLGAALARQGRLNEGIEHFSEAVKIQPDYPKAYYDLGLAMARQGRLKEAIRYYAVALQIRPDYPEAQNSLGVALSRQGRVEDAMVHFEAALKARPGHAKAHNNLGVELAKVGRLEEAIGHFSEAVRINPEYAEAHNNLGLACVRQGRLEEAIGHFSEAVRIRPDYKEAQNNLKLGLQHLGRSPWEWDTRLGD
jgi:tetratricopeptide (TPR) repeat protein